MSRLAGKGALILGAANRDNMAQVIARRFRDEGARIIVAGRKMEELERFAAEIGGEALRCDITSHDEVAGTVAAARERLGQLDVAVNATGWGLLKPFLDTSVADVEAMTALQFEGPFYFLQACVAAMAIDRGGRGGSIIQISSATATIMLNDHAAYMGTKAGTDHVVRCVAHEFGSVGIRANSISPGLTDTPMNAEAKEIPGLFEAFRAGYPLGRWGTSADVAAAAVFLASDECFMTGENLQVNGGLTLRRNPSREEIAASVQKATRS